MPDISKVVEFARRTFLNDGAEGETVHMLCNEIERLQGWREEYEQQVIVTRNATARAEQAEAKLARVGALVGEWERAVEINGVGGPPRQSGASIALMNCAAEIRKALQGEGGG
jgi:hypothetical protein